MGLITHVPPGWYIILYHEVSWEENDYLRGIGGTCPPDIFRQHVRTLASLGDLVSIAEGQELLEKNKMDRPVFSFWFDDALMGVWKYAQPILDEYGVTGAISVCSRFMRQAEFFWRFKLSYLNAVDGMRFLRSRLKKYGFKMGDSVKHFTLDHFSLEMLNEINELFERFTSPEQRVDAFRMFMGPEVIRQAYDHGWCIANHSAGHYPIYQTQSLSLLQPEFQECEIEIQDVCGVPSTYWVLPFDLKPADHEAVIRSVDAGRGDRKLVFVSSQRNSLPTFSPARTLYRFSAPIAASDRLIKVLSTRRF